MKKYFLFLFVFVLSFSVFAHDVKAYGECDQYGLFSMYDSLSDSCKCMSGYVFGEDILGQTQCISGLSACFDKYGYSSTYDSLSKSCTCSPGYTFGKNAIGQ